MTNEAELQPLLQVASFRPSDVLTKARYLRDRSRQCADLADTSVTVDAKQVFSSLAEQLRSEADQLEDAVDAIRKIYADASSDSLTN